MLYFPIALCVSLSICNNENHKYEIYVLLSKGLWVKIDDMMI